VPQADPAGRLAHRLVYYDEGQFSPSGFIHLACAGSYFETADIAEPLLHFSLRSPTQSAKNCASRSRAARFR
jgi:hypothetical protein